MAKKATTKRRIPAPKVSGDDCVIIDGLKLCPHVAYLTEAQQKTVKNMHTRNVSRMEKLKAAEMAEKAKKKKAKA